MARFLALALFLGSSAFAADIEIDELPEADVVETATAAAIDLSDDDDFAIDTSAAKPVATAQPTLPTVDLSDSADDFAIEPAPVTAATIAAPGPRLPTVDHVDFGDEDDFAFEASAAISNPSGTSTVELVELDEDIEASLDEDEDARVELPELEGLDDAGLPEEAAAPETTTGDIKGLLSDDDDIELAW